MTASYIGITQRFAGVLSAAVVALGTVWSATAEANPVLRIIDSEAGTTDIVDQTPFSAVPGSTFDFDPATGQVAAGYTTPAFAPALGYTSAAVSGGSSTLWHASVAAGLSNDTATPPSITQNIHFNVDSTGAGTITLQISENNLTVDALGNAFLNIGGTNTAGIVSSKVYIDAGNTLFGEGLLVLSSADLSGPGFNQSLYTALGDLNAPFSLTLEVMIEHFDAGITTGNANLTLLPEPVSTALLGLGLLGAGLLRRRAAR